MNIPQTFARAWIVLAVLALLGCLAPALADGDASPRWQSMLGKSFAGDAKSVGVAGLVVYRTPGCVFLQMDGKVYCSAAGANNFKLVTDSWQEVCARAQQRSNPKHVFVLSDAGIKESTDGGATWMKPIALPKDFERSSETWVQYDATNDALYLLQKGGDLYKLARRK